MISQAKWYGGAKLVTIGVPPVTNLSLTDHTVIMVHNTISGFKAVRLPIISLIIGRVFLFHNVTESTFITEIQSSVGTFLGNITPSGGAMIVACPPSGTIYWNRLMTEV